MWYRSPVIWKVVCVKVENFEIGLLWCFNFPPVNYQSISKQKRFKFGFNPKQYIKPKWTQIVHKFGSGLVGTQGQVGWVNLVSLIYRNTNNFLYLEKHLNQEWAMSWWILMYSCLLTRNVFSIVWSLIFMGKTEGMEELMHNRMVVKAVAVQHHIVLASFHTNRWCTMIIRFAAILFYVDKVFFVNPGS